MTLAAQSSQQRFKLLRQALLLATPPAVTDVGCPETTTERTLTRRGVLWLGQTCNLRCSFCYFADMVATASHPEHSFMSLEKAKAICRTLVDFYGNTALDLQGGEPTIYPGILELVAFCRDIGLAPTLITNGLLLDDQELCLRYRDAGVNDFLVSVQGLGEVHDRLVGVTGAHRRQMTALRNLRELAIPFRFNCVMSGPALSQLPDIALLARETGARVVNFITFNPFADQGRNGRRTSDNVPSYSEVKPLLQSALEILETAGIEVNVRYFPFCMVEERYRHHVYNFQQLSYDHCEWDFASWGWTGLKPQRTRDGQPSPPVALNASPGLTRAKEIFKKLAEARLLKPLLYSGYRIVSRVLASSCANPAELYRRVAKIHADIHCEYRYGEACQTCNLMTICDGFHGDYAEIFGMDEAEPVHSAGRVDDPTYYISRQAKVL
ncbi:radical SAM protein [Geobacter benzoatilyticus]|uniref:Radical SAM protein n=1 Tax=Geobacter benzoatilyticus TaxID=2815309 RepID=A0ABX7Q0K6_9BACT|nr:radical SAM protein [Geobacter benzoatilyticus]QSV44934.1 radical SAM protein [Geobacter benzoatilyticus]